MNEKEIRDRIGQFLKKTARTVIVPASMGLGLSSSACHGNGLKHPGDAGPDWGADKADASTRVVDLAEDAIKNDVPLMMVPYVVAMALDAAVDTALDVTQASDADRDVLSDARGDVWSPIPPYLAPPPPDAAVDVTREASRADADRDAPLDVRADMAFPPPPYVVPPNPPGEPMGAASPTPPDKK